MLSHDHSAALQAQVQAAIQARTPLRLVGGNSKAFYAVAGNAQQTLALAEHRGIISYEPSELVLQVRAGTLLSDINALLAEHGQMLAFEPPQFAPSATIGGTLACGFSGPRRPFAGSARDFVLGCRLLNGRGELLQFGGQVMKNVAGFDASRLVVGALGQLGVLLDVSIRVQPCAQSELTLRYPCPDATSAIQRMQQWQAQPLPLSALAYDQQHIWLRLSGAPAAVTAAAATLGAAAEPADTAFWLKLREQQLDFFQQQSALWRISVAPATPPLALAGECLLEWGGAQRWLCSSAPAATIHAAAQAHGGHAVCFRGPDKTDWIRFEPAVLALQQRLRLAFDPQQLFNPGRFHPEL